MTQQAPPSKIAPLTSSRFFAAMYVVLYHGLGTDPNPSPTFAMRLISLGYISVSFFFMLSGFILAFVYLKDNRPVSKRRFFLSRIARIYPLYLAAMLLDLPRFLHVQRQVVHATIMHIVESILASVFLIQAWLPTFDGLNIPGWSLSVEAFFYLLFPFLAFALWRLRGWIIVLFSVAVYFAGIGLVQIIDSHVPNPGGQSYIPFPFLFLFLLGITLAKLLFWINQSPARTKSLQEFAPWLLLGSIAAYLAIPTFSLHLSKPLLQHGLLAPLFALAILAFAAGNRWIVLLFSSNWMVMLGEASFALYLIHYPLGMILRGPIEHHGTPMYLAYIALCIALSLASLRWLETPARLWILKKERVGSPETGLTSAIS